MTLKTRTEIGRGKMNEEEAKNCNEDKDEKYIWASIKTRLELMRFKTTFERERKVRMR